jgi:hypothetical protein
LPAEAEALAVAPPEVPVPPDVLPPEESLAVELPPDEPPELSLPVTESTVRETLRVTSLTVFPRSSAATGAGTAVVAISAITAPEAMRCFIVSPSYEDLGDRQ